MKGSEQDVKANGQVIDLARQKQKRLVLAAFDRLEHQDKRDQAEQRAQVERASRNRL